MASFDPAAAVARLEIAFAELLEESTYGGAALALCQGDQCLLSLHGGEASPENPWSPSTSSLIWSASKGIAATATLHALQQKDICLQTPVARLWPEFAANGKAHITFAQLLSHRAGLAAIDAKGLSIIDYQGVTATLASQPSNWSLDERHGYGARTFGFLLDEIVRRCSGMTLREYWNTTCRDPLELEIWFGVPEKFLETVATVIAPKTPPEPSDFSRAFADPSSLTRRALSEPGGLLTPSVMNTIAMRTASIPSLGVIATADALARFYALLAGPNEFFTDTTRSQMQTTLSRGLDLTLLAQTSFSAGFMTNDIGVANPVGVYGSGKKSFGHPGAGGSLGFADPELGLGFAFIPSAMHPGALPGARTRKLIQALYGLPSTA
ncbi:MAG: serine hydrolase domain-containing protein [bacterium]